MQLLKSLLCLQGYDNRNRFIIISAISYLSFIIFSTFFISYPTISVIFLFIQFYIFALTTLRRLNDAKLNQNWGVSSSISFFIVGIIIIFIQFNGAYWLLLFPLVLSSLLITCPSKNKKNYVLGYHGPIDLSHYNHSALSQRRIMHRIEPTIVGTNINANIEQGLLNSSFINNENQTYINQDTTNQQNIGEYIRLFLMEKKNVLITIIVIVVLQSITFIISKLNFSLPAEIPQTSSDDIEYKKLSRLHEVKMPDNYILMLSEFNGVTINWQTDVEEESLVWSLFSAQGDDSCKVISFNNGDEIRTVSVTNEGIDGYYANFSPLDTRKILKNIAFRGDFTICGYTFSLKGSQAILGKNSAYLEYIEY